MVAVSLVSIVSMAGGFFFTPVVTRAETVDALKVKIAELLRQIADLQAKMAELRKSESEVVSALLDTLGPGSRGDKVKTLQALLASDPDLYPEAFITGYYGPLTTKAVRRFQKHNDIEQVGVVGPKTLKKLNKLFEKYPLAFEDGDEDGDNEHEDEHRGRICAIVAPGHLIAPGWLRKHGGQVLIVPLCQKLPHGIAKKLGQSTSTPPTNPDSTAPVLSAIGVSASSSSATIVWTTNELADSQVRFGTSTAYGLQSALQTSLQTHHTVTIGNLATSTIYHFQIRSRDFYGNLATSTDSVFTTTSGSIDSTPPVITSVTAAASSTSARITWQTDEAASGKVFYATSTPLSLGDAATVSTSTLTTAHDFSLIGLTASSTYYFVVESVDAHGNRATSTERSFLSTAL